MKDRVTNNEKAVINGYPQLIHTKNMSKKLFIGSNPCPIQLSGYQSLWKNITDPNRCTKVGKSVILC
jgi:hypothetical protein